MRILFGDYKLFILFVFHEEFVYFEGRVVELDSRDLPIFDGNLNGDVLRNKIIVHQNKGNE